MRKRSVKKGVAGVKTLENERYKDRYRTAESDPCRHCYQRQANCLGRLCKRCYSTPWIRALHPPLGPSNPGLRDGKKAPLAPQPTTYPPGSRDKIEVMAERVQQGYQPCHPLDASGDVEKSVSNL